MFFTGDLAPSFSTHHCALSIQLSHSTPDSRTHTTRLVDTLNKVIMFFDTAILNGTTFHLGSHDEDRCFAFADVCG